METPQGNLQALRRLDVKFVFLAGLLAVFLYLSGFLLLLLPLPFLYVFKKGGRVRGLLALGFALFILILLYAALVPWVARSWGEESALQWFFWMPGLIPPLSKVDVWTVFGDLLSFLFFALIGALLGFFEPRLRSITRMIGQIELILIVLMLSTLLIYSRGDLLGFLHNFEKFLAELLRQVARLSAANNPELKSQFEIFETKADLMAYYVLRLLPGWLVSSSIFVQWLNIVVSRKIFLKEVFFFQLGALRRWGLPFSVVWLTLVTIAAWLLDRSLFHSEWLSIVAYNFFFVLALLYFFQGIAIAVFYSVRWRLAPLTRFFFYLILVLFFYPLGIILMALGFFDAWFDFRRLSKQDAASQEAQK